MAELVAADGVALGTDIVVTGVADVSDPDHTFGYLDATGTSSGTALRDLGPARPARVQGGDAGT